MTNSQVKTQNRSRKQKLSKRVGKAKDVMRGQNEKFPMFMRSLGQIFRENRNNGGYNRNNSTSQI